MWPVRRQPHSAGSPGRASVWWRAKHPVVRFTALFVLFASAFYLLSALPAYGGWVLSPYLALNAKISSVLLRCLGEAASSEGSHLLSPRFALEIRAGCDAIEPAALFVAAVLAFPAPLRRKLKGIAAGAPALLIINFARILSLYYIGIYQPALFDVAHASVWQPLFVLLVGIFWLLWAVQGRAEEEPLHGAG
jgi:exosortase H (IPTLxxWG-CTERM-specific)